MLNREQFTYLLSQTGKGLDVEAVRAKWNRTYPDVQIDENDARTYLAERAKRVEAGFSPQRANEDILAGVGFTKPRLSLRRKA